MRIIHIPTSSRLTIEREPTDKKFYSESAFFHALKVKLQNAGFDVIKRLMVADGHMVSEGIYYLRSRLKSVKRYFSVYDPNYQIRNLAKEYNERGYVILTIQEPDNFKPTLPTKE